MTDWVTPVATPIPVGGGGILSRCPRASATCSACSSAAPRSGLVSTYSGTTSRSAPGNTTRCTTRRLRPAAAGTGGTPTAPSLATDGRPAVASSVIAAPEAAQRLVAGEERSHPVVVHGERGSDGHVHVEVLVGAQATAEDHARLTGRHFPVSQ